MKIIIRNYGKFGDVSNINFIEIHEADDAASQPTTDEELQAIRPRPLGSNEQLEVMDDEAAASYMQLAKSVGFEQHCEASNRYWNPK